MKLSIIVEDSEVYKDKESFIISNFSIVPSNVRALQFDDATNTGHIEFSDYSNELITELPDWAISISNEYDIETAAYKQSQENLMASYLANKKI